MPRSTWRHLMDVDDQAVPYQLPEWHDALCEVTDRRDASRLYVFEDGRRVVVPLAEKRRVGVRSQSSQPEGWGMGGAVGDPGVDDRHLHAVVADMSIGPWASTRVRPNPLRGAQWAAAVPRATVRVPRVAHVIDLHRGWDDLWATGFHKTTRKSVRRAERAGVVVESDTTGRLVPVFYELFLCSVTRWARRHHEPEAMAHWRAQRRDPIEKFEAIARHMGERCRFWVAWHDGRPVAASMVLTAGNVNDARAVMDKARSDRVRAADLLLKSSIEEACGMGCGAYHLGDSGTSTGLARYKSRFGATAVPYDELVLERFPLSRVEGAARKAVKRLVGFEDAR